MGIDFYCCKNCNECLNENCFNQCQLCYGKFDDCDECEKYYDHILNIKKDVSKEDAEFIKNECAENKEKIKVNKIKVCEECYNRYSISKQEEFKKEKEQKDIIKIRFEKLISEFSEEDKKFINEHFKIQ